MFAMQYAVESAASAETGAFLAQIRGDPSETCPVDGLIFQAFLFSDCSEVCGAATRCSSLSLWRDPKAMANYLLSRRFAAIFKTREKPAVRSWIPLEFREGFMIGRTPLYATQSFAAIPAGAEATVVRQADRRESADDASNIHSTLLGLDPMSWQVMRFSLWIDRPASKDGTCYEVLHLASPGLNLPPFQT